MCLSQSQNHLKKGVYPLQNNTTTLGAGCQPPRILRDISPRGHDRKWAERKVQNEYLAAAYDKVNPDKAIRLRTCSTVLTFREYEGGEKRIEGMNSCRVRLCPICSWRRSLKNYYNTMRIMEQLQQQGDFAFVFATLTLRNVRGGELVGTLDGIFEAWNRFAQAKPIKKAVLGWYRGVEITHDTEMYLTAERIALNPKYYADRGLQAGVLNPNYDTFHPHMHLVFCVRKSYFTSRDYISKQTLADLWQRAARLDYSPVCDIRKVKGDLTKSCAEISKYAAKVNEYIVPDDWDLTVDTVRVLDAALAHRRLVAYGGLLRDTFRALRLEDAESGNLAAVGEATPEGDEYRLVTYFWQSGYRQYIAR